MKRVEMSTIRTTLRLGRERYEIEVPGGWLARVPEVMADRETLEAYTRYFQADGLPPAAARAAAEAAIQATFEGGFMKGLRHSLRRWSRIYAKRFPDARTPEGTLRGFDPERMQSAFMPMENVGRRGKAFVTALMVAMHKEAEGGA